MYKKIYSTEKFKPSDTVWFCEFELNPSGSIRRNITPTTAIIQNVSSEWIEIMDSDDCYERKRFYIDDEMEGDSKYKRKIGLHIAETREKAVKLYNNLILETIENRYSLFRILEAKLLKRIL